MVHSRDVSDHPRRRQAWIATVFSSWVAIRTRGIQLALLGAADPDDPNIAATRAELIADCHRIMGDGHPMCSALGERA